MSGPGVPAAGERHDRESSLPLLHDEAYLARVRERLVAALDPKVLDPFSPVPDRTARIEAVVHAHLAETFPRVVPDSSLVRRLCDELAGLGPLATLMADPDVSDVLVNGPTDVWVERRGRLEATPVRFRDVQHLSALMEKLAALVGRHLSLESPCVDARMADGSRANLVIAPVGGPCLSIRKHRRVRLALRREHAATEVRDAAEAMPVDWVAAGGLSAAMATFLATAVRARLNLLIAGATGAGKTTLLASLLAVVPPNERVIIIEDTTELAVPEHGHTVRLQCVHGHRAVDYQDRTVSVADLVANALRMRPDRLVVGEIRSPREAYVCLEALNTGHAGSGTTIHANGAADALGRLETLVRREYRDVALRELREPIARAFDLVLHVGRLGDGRRAVLEVVELAGTLTDGVYDLRPVFAADRAAGDASVTFEAVDGYRPGPKLTAKLRLQGLLE
ncbi:MAG: ATPase, T2SS/T4P/T4SS family [Chloroflexi bacterium]|nr:ATPase, T2SS/T4P/T4SS family [Chloroflexota bacterium]